MRYLFVERRYFKFQDEIQFSSDTIMEHLKHRDSDSFCGYNMNWFYQVLHHITCMTAKASEPRGQRGARPRNVETAGAKVSFYPRNNLPSSSAG